MTTTNTNNPAEPVAADDKLIAFEVVDGKPTPIFPVAGREVNGSTIISLRDCVARFGGTETSRRREWQAIWGPYLNDRPAREAESVAFMFKLIDGVPLPHKSTGVHAVDGVEYIDSAYAAAKFGGTTHEWDAKWVRMIGYMAATIDPPLPTIHEAVKNYLDGHGPTLEARAPLKIEVPLRLAQAVDFYQRISRIAADFDLRGCDDIDDGVVEQHIQFSFQQLLSQLREWLSHAARNVETMLPSGKVGA